MVSLALRSQCQVRRSHIVGFSGGHATPRRIRQPEDESQTFPDLEARIKAVREFRADWVSKSVDCVGWCVAKVSDCKAHSLSTRWVRASLSRRHATSRFRAGAREAGAGMRGLPC